jgi:hypothetical protein
MKVVSRLWRSVPSSAYPALTGGANICRDYVASGSAIAKLKELFFRYDQRRSQLPADCASYVAQKSQILRELLCLASIKTLIHCLAQDADLSRVIQVVLDSAVQHHVNSMRFAANFLLQDGVAIWFSCGFLQ